MKHGQELKQWGSTLAQHWKQLSTLKNAEALVPPAEILFQLLGSAAWASQSLSCSGSSNAQPELRTTRLESDIRCYFR